jgi:hypothetical protein
MQDGVHPVFQSYIESRLSIAQITLMQIKRQHETVLVRSLCHELVERSSRNGSKIVH